MQQPASSASSSAPPTFAGILAALAAPAKKSPPAWNDDDLADDVATLSYERALRAHARYRAPEVIDRPLTRPSRAHAPEAGNLSIFEASAFADEAKRPRIFEVSAVAESLPAQAATAQATSPSRMVAEPLVTQETPPEPDRPPKSVSIHIRLSAAEGAQVRKRAAEAGLSVSVYLRTCTLEAESLRTLVKDTLAQLRTQASKDEQDAASQPRGPWFGRWRQFWPHSRASQPIVRS